jgi:adenylosuccinate lyase
MGRIWSDTRRFETWLQVEIAAAEAMAAAAIVPAAAAKDMVRGDQLSATIVGPETASMDAGRLRL